MVLLQLRSLKSLMVLCLPAVLFCRQTDALANVDTFIGNDTINVCKESRRIVVTVEVGDIFAADSLLGYDVSVTFDPRFLVLDRVLTIGTLSESLEEGTAEDFRRPGVANIQGFNLLSFMKSFGNRPLIALSGEYFGDCADEALIEIAEVTYSKLQPNGVTTVDVDGNILEIGKVVALEEAEESSQVEIEIGAEEEVVLAEGARQSAVIPIRLKDRSERGISELSFEVSIADGSQFELLEVRSEEDGVTVEKFARQEETEGLYDVRCTISTTANVAEQFLSLRVENIENLDAESDLVLRPVQVNTCSCVSQLLGSSVVLKSVKKDTTVSTGLQDAIQDKKSVKIVDSGSEWIIESVVEGLFLANVKIYTVLGQMLINKSVAISNGAVTIPIDSLVKGVYLLDLEFSDATTLKMNISKQ